ncbi:5-hydroxytryptamine receptor 1A-like [Stylophora pistillata]|uniref:5-hydroxytryptamine receptor 1A-like n=1 Tax=Stylophora pistillata TaxID=50429 RepID=UPI000C042C44|nr:5-hydroxytryptamine receptor 1A-like [Stylophora pistillata]
MSTTDFSSGGTHIKTFLDLRCSPTLVGGIQLASTFFAAVDILLAITAFLGNSLILVALHKESSLHPPSKLLYRCLATTDLLIGLVSQPLAATHWMSLVHEHWSICRYTNGPAYITGVALSAVSLLTMAAISVDRLLALLLGLRYKHIVTLKCLYIIVTLFWVLSLTFSLIAVFVNRITVLYIRIVIPFCLVISLVSYTKIYCILRHQQSRVKTYVQQQPSQQNTLDLARYRKALYSTLWVQSAFVVCYAPFYIVETAIAHTKTYSSYFIVLRKVAVVLVYFNSTLNPFLYCWKISEIRQAVKKTIRKALCCPWS